MSKKNDIAAEVAIRRNVEAKKERAAKGNLILEVGFIAQQLANRDIELTANQQDSMWILLDAIKSGSDPTQELFIRTIGTIAGEKKRKSPVSWFRNLFYIFEAQIVVDMRNNRVFDFLTGQIYDFTRKRILDMADNDIDYLLKPPIKKD